MMQKCAFILFMLILAGCNQGKHDSEKLDKDSAINQVIDTTVRHLYIQERLRCSGHSAKAMDEIQNLGLFFTTDKKMNQQQARDLILIAHGQFLKNINESKAIRPYLKQYPFDYKDVEVMIEYVGNVPFITEGLIAVVNCFGNKIYYKIKKDKYTPSTIHQTESLDEAKFLYFDELDKTLKAPQ